jgi:hypothetical protein
LIFIEKLEAILKQQSPSFFSLLAAGTGQRLLTAAILVAGLWLAVVWALH